MVWGWIASLSDARATVAERLVALGQPVPDDLPEGSPVERLATTGAGRAIGTAVFVAAVLGLIVAAVVMSL